MFRFCFFRVFGGGPEGAPIWSSRSAAFRFVQVCSDLFRVVQGCSGVGGRAWGAELICGRGGGHWSHFCSSRGMVARLGKVEGRMVPACAGMTEESVGMTGEGAGMTAVRPRPGARPQPPLPKFIPPPFQGGG